MTEARVALRCFVLAGLLGACGGSSEVGERQQEADIAIIQELGSPDPQRRESALAMLEQRSSVSGTVLSQLVTSFKYETSVHLPGPPATATRTSDVLMKFSPASLPHLAQGLGAADPNVRRHSAFTLGELRDRRMIPILQKAILEEELRAMPTTATSADPIAALAPFRAMIVAYGKIDRDHAVAWARGRRDGSSRQFIDTALAILGDEQ